MIVVFENNTIFDSKYGLLAYRQVHAMIRKNFFRHNTFVTEVLPQAGEGLADMDSNH